jgi:hypothetical protein
MTNGQLAETVDWNKFWERDIMTKQYRICLASTNQWTDWRDLTVAWDGSDCLNIQFSAQLTVDETIAFFKNRY